MTTDATWTIHNPGWGVPARSMRQTPNGGWQDASTIVNGVLGPGTDVLDKAEVKAGVVITPHVRVRGPMVVENVRHLLTVGPLGTRHDYLTAWYAPDGTIYVTTGCLVGTLEKFEEQVKSQRPGPQGDEYLAAAAFLRSMARFRRAEIPSPVGEC